MARWHTTEFDLLPEQAFRPRGGGFGKFSGGMTLEGGGKGGSGPSAAQDAAITKQAGVAEKMQAFLERSYEENKPLMERLGVLNEQVIGQQMRMADASEQRAAESYDFYKNVGRPIVEQSMQESKSWDSEANREAARGRATADVQQGFASAQQQQQRGLQRMGINPNSGRMAALNNQLMMGQALGTAQAATNADETRRVQGTQMRQQAANLAQGFPAQSLGQGAQAGQFGSSAAGVGGNMMGQRFQSQNQMTQGMGSVGNMYGNVAGGYGNMAANQAQQSAGAWSGIGQLAGTAMMMFADGGKVGSGQAGHTGKNLGGEGGKISGPGTGTSDQVTAVNKDTGQPIRLSNGEYIISKDVVEAKGKEFFDKLQAKYHTPVNLGRQA
jgi:hypothetical protein